MLSYSHIRLLKRIKRNMVVQSTKPNKDLDYLLGNGYIEETICDKPNDYYAQPYLTEKGKARLYEQKRKFIEIWIPVVISNLLAFSALIISIIALMK